jgi:cysteine synthase B
MLTSREKLQILVDPLHIPATSSLEAVVGNTPLVRLRHVTDQVSRSVEVYAKIEWTNPGGSVKDRPALYIIREAELRGALTPDKVLLDATSGNAGIAYATYGAARGYKVKLVVPANASPERIGILRTLGAEIVLSDPTEGSDGAILEARRIAAAEPATYYYADQYNNPASWQSHYFTTGPEIIEQTDGQVTHFVAGLGTSGTMMGVGRRLKEYNSTIHLTAVQPESPFHGLEGLKHMPTAIVPGIYDPSLHDELMLLPTEAAHEMARRLAREEGLFVGVSAAAAAAAAIKVASRLDEGVVVTLFPDSGHKYLSERFWRE